eukprot:m.131851 g.131851  ORF g.131851 m.131851 type:complete len:62 (+) comp15758_c0_seq3:3702-3887(+)
MNLCPSIQVAELLLKYDFSFDAGNGCFGGVLSSSILQGDDTDMVREIIGTNVQQSCTALII